MIKKPRNAGKRLAATFSMMSSKIYDYHRISAFSRKNATIVGNKIYCPGFSNLA
jgi:hypothetical protein